MTGHAVIGQRFWGLRVAGSLQMPKYHAGSNGCCTNIISEVYYAISVSTVADSYHMENGAFVR